MAKRLYRVTLRGMTYGQYAHGIAYVVAAEIDGVQGKGNLADWIVALFKTLDGKQQREVLESVTEQYARRLSRSTAASEPSKESK